MKRLSAFSLLLGMLLLLVPAAASANAATQLAATSQSSHVLRMPCGNGGTSGDYNVTATVLSLGKFVGNKKWGSTGRPPDYYIDINGKLSSVRGTTTLRVSY